MQTLTINSPPFSPTCLHVHRERLENHSNEGDVAIKRIHHPVLHHCECTNLADGVEKERGGVERGKGREKSKEREVCQVIASPVLIYHKSVHNVTCCNTRHKIKYCIYLLQVKDRSLNVSNVGRLKSMTQHFSGFPHTKLFCLQHRDLKRSTLGERKEGERGKEEKGGREMDGDIK